MAAVHPESRAHGWVRHPPVAVVGLSVALVVLLVTAGFARQVATSRENRRASEFDRVAVQVTQALSDEVNARMDEFSFALDFVQAVDRIDEDEFHTLLSLRDMTADSAAGTSPGLVVMEYTTDLAALEQRERAAGRSDFTLMQLGTASPGRNHLVITHTENPAQVGDRPAVGLEVTSLIELFGVADVLESQDIVARVFTDDTMAMGTRFLAGEPSRIEDDFEQVVLFIAAPWTANDGATSGVMLRLDSVNAVIRNVVDAVPQGFSLEVRVAGSDQFIASIDNRSSLSEQFATTVQIEGLADQAAGEFAQLTIRLSASDRLTAPGEPSLTKTWVFGSIAALLLAAVAMLRTRQSRRLAETGVELEIANLMASTDHLTGLLNRHGLQEVVGPQGGGSATFLFIDIDNFKSVNDQSGHGEGDKVLRSVAAELGNIVRAGDEVCRLGGDEFLLYLRGQVSESRVDDLAEQIESAVAALDPRISASVGVARRRAGDSRTLADVMQAADEDMYRIKRNKKRHARS